MPGGKLSAKEAEAIAPIGNSPTFLTWEQMQRVVPLWYNLSVTIFDDDEANPVRGRARARAVLHVHLFVCFFSAPARPAASLISTHPPTHPPTRPHPSQTHTHPTRQITHAQKKWGWVQEMYAFTIALYNAGVRRVDLALHMMSQPPWDTKMDLSPGKPYSILHYTYGCDYTHEGKFTPGGLCAWCVRVCVGGWWWWCGGAPSLFGGREGGRHCAASAPRRPLYLCVSFCLSLCKSRSSGRAGEGRGVEAVCSRSPSLARRLDGPPRHTHTHTHAHDTTPTPHTPTLYRQVRRVAL